MSKVFILEPSKNDVSAAEKYGDIIYLYPNGERRISIWASQFVSDTLERLEDEDFNRNEDYFLAVGGLVPLMMVVGALIGKYGFINALLFNSSSRDYIVKTIGDYT